MALPTQSRRRPGRRRNTSRGRIDRGGTSPGKNETKFAFGTGRRSPLESIGREAAHESPTPRNGIFSRFLIEALTVAADLDGDGRVELDELARFTKKSLPDFVKDECGPEVNRRPELKGE